MIRDSLLTRIVNVGTLGVRRVGHSRCGLWALNGRGVNGQRERTAMKYRRAIIGVTTFRAVRRKIRREVGKMRISAISAPNSW